VERDEGKRGRIQRGERERENESERVRETRNDNNDKREEVKVT
jgi:hypothetical protein